jgi:hypothetical protein
MKKHGIYAENYTATVCKRSPGISIIKSKEKANGNEHKNLALIRLMAFVLALSAIFQRWIL